MSNDLKADGLPGYLSSVGEQWTDTEMWKRFEQGWSTEQQYCDWNLNHDTPKSKLWAGDVPTRDTWREFTKYAEDNRKRTNYIQFHYWMNPPPKLEKKKKDSSSSEGQKKKDPPQSERPKKKDDPPPPPPERQKKKKDDPPPPPPERQKKKNVDQPPPLAERRTKRRATIVAEKPAIPLEEEGPVEAVPAEEEAAPLESVETEAAPLESVEKEAAPLESVEKEAAPLESVEKEAAPADDEAAPLESVEKEEIPAKPRRRVKQTARFDHLPVSSRYQLASHGRKARGEAGKVEERKVSKSKVRPSSNDSSDSDLDKPLAHLPRIPSPTNPIRDEDVSEEPPIPPAYRDYLKGDNKWGGYPEITDLEIFINGGVAGLQKKICDQEPHLARVLDTRKYLSNMELVDLFEWLGKVYPKCERSEFAKNYLREIMDDIFLVMSKDTFGADVTLVAAWKGFSIVRDKLSQGQTPLCKILGPLTNALKSFDKQAQGPYAYQILRFFRVYNKELNNEFDFNEFKTLLQTYDPEAEISPVDENFFKQKKALPDPKDLVDYYISMRKTDILRLRDKLKNIYKCPDKKDNVRKISEWVLANVKWPLSAAQLCYNKSITEYYLNCLCAMNVINPDHEFNREPWSVDVLRLRNPENPGPY